MFGYIIANYEALTNDEKQRYHACYCGLCHSLKNKHSEICRLTLNYDMLFLVLVLTEVYGSDTSLKQGNCLLHPFKKHSYVVNEITDYAAAMNVILTYYNLMDNWNDSRSMTSLGGASALKRQVGKIEIMYPRQCTAIKEELATLARIEKDGVTNADIPAACFGRLMGEIFVLREDENAEALYSFGMALGRFIYILDAVIDLKRDLKKESYNPLISMPTTNYKDILEMLMADCTKVFNRLEQLKDDELIKNILYSGVWTKYEIAQAKEKKNK